MISKFNADGTTTFTPQSPDELAQLERDPTLTRDILAFQPRFLRGPTRLPDPVGPRKLEELAFCVHSLVTSPVPPPDVLRESFHGGQTVALMNVLAVVRFICERSWEPCSCGILTCPGALQKAFLDALKPHDGPETRTPTTPR